MLTMLALCYPDQVGLAVHGLVKWIIFFPLHSFLERRNCLFAVSPQQSHATCKELTLFHVLVEPKGTNQGGICRGIGDSPTREGSVLIVHVMDGCKELRRYCVAIIHT